MAAPHGTYSWFQAVCLTAVVISAACGEPSGPAEELPPPTGPVSARVGADGGTVSVVTEEGVVVSLSIPAGALRADTLVTLRPLPPSDGRWLNVGLEPAGLRLDKAFTLAARPPATVPVENASLLIEGDRTILLPTSTGSEPREIRTTSLSFFGFAAQEAIASAGTAAVASWASGAGSSNLTAGSLTCQQVISATQMAFNGYIDQGQFHRAVETALDIASLLQKDGCPGVEAWLGEARRIACEQQSSVLQEAREAPTMSHGDFLDQVEPIMQWLALTTLLGADCEGGDEYLSVLDGEIEDFLQFHGSKLQSLSALEWSTFQDLKDEAVTVMALYRDALTLGVPEPAADRILQRAFNPTVDRMREVAFGLCRSGGWHYPLSRLTSYGFFSARDIVGTTPPRPGTIWPPPRQYAGFTDAEIFEDLQYCATDLEIAGLVASGGSLASVQAGTTGTAGDLVHEVVLETPTRGTLRLTGSLGAFTCWNDIEADQEITVSLDDVEVLTIARSGTHYIDGDSIAIDLVQAAEMAGITPKEGETHELVLTRQRSECNRELWGEPSYDLVTATLTWKNPTLDVSVSMPTEVYPGTETQADIRVRVTDQLGQPGFFPDIDVVLEVAGGSASQTSGQTDPEGYFRSPITIDPAAESVVVRATATSFEGLIAVDSTSASVGSTGRIVPLDQLSWSAADAGVEYDHDELDAQSFVNASVSSSVATDSFSANATLSVQYDFSGDRLVLFGGSASGNGTGAGVNGRAKASLNFDVVDGDVPFEFVGSHDGHPDASGGATLQRRVDKDWEVLSRTVNGSFSEIGTLSPGRYQIHVHGETWEGTMSFDFTFLVPEPAGGA